MCSTPSRKPWFNSPVAYPRNELENYPLEATALKKHAHNEWSATDISRTLVGPIPAANFLERFLPTTDNELDSGMPPCIDAFKEVPHEGNLYESLVYDLNGGEACNASQRCSGITFQLGHHSGCLRSENRVEDTIYAYSLGDSECENLSGSAQLLVNLHADDSSGDPSNESIHGDVGSGSEYNVEIPLKSAYQTLGQQVSLATDIFAQQHRNFLFSILMTPTHARFLFWDHAGVAISSSFDYRSQPEVLCKFLWRFGHMTDAQRGSDTTVKTANKTEERIFAEAIKVHVRTQLGNKYKMLAEEYRRHYVPGRVIKIPVRKCMRVMLEDNASAQPATERIEIDDSQEDVEFLVSRPVATPRCVVSSATKGYWAVHAKNKTVHFLKDAWRTAVNHMEIEGLILEKLAHKGVRNVPTILFWSDVGPVDNNMHCTQTDAHKAGDWNTRSPDNISAKVVRLIRRVHYRQVTEEAGYTLEQLAGTYELLKGAHDVFEALFDAHTLCNRFHRDVSSSNIILFADPAHQYSERRAILVDWELSCEDIESPARDYWISGTWAFMSINALQAIRRKYYACDDIESLIYVIFYCAVHFLQWKKYDLDNHREIHGTFFHYCAPNGLTGGIGKENNTINGRYFNAATFEDVSQWLTKSVPLIRKYYGPDTKALAAAVFADYKPIFERKQSYWKTLSKRNREVHKLLYKGPPLDVHRAPTVSSHHTSVILVEDDPPAKSPNEGSSLKRDLASIEQPVFESSSKRQKTDQKEVIAAHPRKGLAKRMKKRLPDKLKH